MNFGLLNRSRLALSALVVIAFGVAACAEPTVPAAPVAPATGATTPALELPPGTKFVNGTGQLPIMNSVFKAPGFTSQGYLEICENAGPHVYFAGLNWSDTPLTIRSSYQTNWDVPLVRITYGARNRQLGLKSPAEETVVEPHQYYVSDAMALTLKAGDRLILRNFVPLEKDTTIGCGTISVSELRPGNRWPYGNVTGGEDRTLDPNLEADFKPTSDFLCVPFLLAGENVRPEARFVVAFGDSLTQQSTKDKNGGWFQNAFADTPHTNLAIGGDALGNVISKDGKLRDALQEARFALARYGTDVINFYGHNDLGNGRPVAEMLELDRQFCARPELRGLRKWRCTLTPYTHNKKGVALGALTAADQTPSEYSDGIVQYNGAVRRDYAKLGYNGVIETGGALALGLDSVYWKPGMAADGTHFGRNLANDLIKPEARAILAAG